MVVAWDHRLQQAIWDRDVERALKLIAAGYPVRARDSEGLTALYWAASKGLLQVVEALIAAGANVNATTICGLTPLSAAMGGAHWEIIATLLAHGANIHVRDRVNGFTLLHYAALIDNRETALSVAALALTIGVDPAVRDDGGETAFHWLEEFHPGATRELKKRGPMPGFC